MNVSCTKENLLEGLTRVAHVAGKNVSLPILSNVLIKTERGGITLVTTNLETGIRTHIRGKVEAGGACTVPAGLFMEYVSLLPNDVVTLTLENGSLSIVSKTRTSKIKSLSADEFPVLPEVERDNEVALDSALLKQAVGQVSVAVATDDSRPEISGALMRLEGKNVILAATDSYRLGERVFSSETNQQEPRQVILPVRTLQELSRIVEGAASITMALSDSQVRFTVGETELISRLIEGQYPDYRQIIPSTSATECTMDVDVLLQAVRSTSLFCKSGINDVVLAVQPEKKRVLIQATNTQVGESTSIVSAENIEGQGLQIVFNYRYLMDGLSNIGAPKVRLQLVDQSSPGVLRPAEETGYLYLLMPIKQ